MTRHGTILEPPGERVSMVTSQVTESDVREALVAAVASLSRLALVPDVVEAEIGRDEAGRIVRSQLATVSGTASAMYRCPDVELAPAIDEATLVAWLRRQPALEEICVQSWILTDGHLVPAREFRGPLPDELYVQGAVELMVDETTVLSRAKVDLVDQLLWYLVEGVQQVMDGRSFSVGFPTPLSTSTSCRKTTRSRSGSRMAPPRTRECRGVPRRDRRARGGCTARD